ncbi:hypothetical protein BGZ95_011968 [Linnemannia exigua]|uniref:F-box domain-containing protein n=1 Tax=Linnemannia exigua TaxID=604196 RepID=A0AAD4D970_9FUNG|nr:hypothetical protein BGZ95_011968 [Linnemannia exigua]
MQVDRATHRLEDLPAEAFQHICRFCTIHELAALRTLSIRVRDLVDDSITSRKTFAEPYKYVESMDKPTSSRQAKPKHNPHSCYVHITLKRNTKPITAVFTRYSKEHNYLEFTQKDATCVEIDHDSSTLGQLDFSNWEQQLESAKEAKNARANALSPSPPSSWDSSSTTSRPRRSSITQAGPIRAAQIHMEQQLNNGGPIPPIPTSRPIISSIFGSSTATNAAGAGAGTPARGSVLNHMTQFAMNILSSTGSHGMTTEQLTQEAVQTFHAVDNEVLSSKKQYRFHLTEGAHYIGDDDFIIRYTIKVVKPVKKDEDAAPTGANTASAPPPIVDLKDRDHLKFKVDYIRASWRWIASGAPKSLRPSSQPSTVETTKKDLDMTDNEEDDDDEEDKQPWQTLLNPLPDLRIGRMYAHRFNMVLEEIGRQSVTPSVRGELRNLGYDASLFPNKFLYANLRDEHVLEWVTEKHFEEIEQRDRYDDWEMVESMSAREDRDKAELKKMVERLESKQGYLTARNILEEMLACQGYSRDLIWKYGVVRREMMGPVPSQSEAKKLLTKVIDSEAASGTSYRPRPSQL